MKRKVMIVVEETGEVMPNGDKKFIVHMTGHIERIGKIPDEQLSAAEFWGSHFFRIIQNVMIQTGVAKEIMVKDGSGGFKKPI